MEQASNIDFPQIFYGKLRVFVTVEKNGQKMICFEGEGESNPPSMF